MIRLLILIRLLIILLFLALTAEPIYAQAQAFSDKDLKKLEESLKIQSKANETQLETNKIYQEMSMLLQDANYDSDKKMQKEYEKLENKAFDLEKEASKLFGEANKIKWDVYKKYIEDFWENFSGEKSDLLNAVLIEEKGFELLYRASSQRESAIKKTKPEEAISLLNEAYEFEIMGLEKLEMAYQLYRHWPDVPDIEEITVEKEEIKDPTVSFLSTIPEETSTTTTEFSQSKELDTPTDYSSTYESGMVDYSAPSIDKVELDQKKIQRFQKYIEDHKDDSLYALQNYISGYDMESVSQFWSLYRNMELEDRGIGENSQTTEMADDLSVTSYDDTYTETNAESIIEDDINVDQYEKTGYGTTNENEEEIGIVTGNLSSENDMNIIYRVQIAKNKTPLSQGLLSKAYRGNLNIGVINEGGWYKYSIGDFYSYESADSFRNVLNIEEAFVVAYRDIVKFQKVPEDLAQKTDSPPSLINTKKTKTDKTTSPSTFPIYNPSDDNIFYIVQVAASRIPLSRDFVENLYKGQEDIYLRKEEGWHKYQIGHTNSYEQAKRTLRTVDVPGAFIASYKIEDKLKLWEAIRITREESNKITFKVQIAASRVKLDQAAINRIYNGKEEVIETYEDGMYKYQIAAGSTYQAGRRMKNLLGIKGAFIVSYQNGRKIKIKNAIELTK